MSRERLEGTTGSEFSIGKGDITVAGEKIVSFRTGDDGIAQYRNAGGDWQDIPTDIHELSALSLYVDGDVGDNDDDGLAWGTAWKNFDNIANKIGVFGKPIHRAITVNVRGTVRATVAGYMLDLRGIYGSGSISFVGEETVVSSGTVTGVQNSIASTDGLTYLDASAASWTVDAYVGHFVKFKTGYSGKQYVPIGSNTSTRLNIWHPATTVSVGATFDIISFPEILSELVSAPGVNFDSEAILRVGSCYVSVSFLGFNFLNVPRSDGWCVYVDDSPRVSLTRCSMNSVSALDKAGLDIDGSLVYISWAYCPIAKYSFVDVRRTFIKGDTSSTGYGFGVSDNAYLTSYHNRFQYNDYHYSVYGNGRLNLGGKNLFEACAIRSIHLEGGNISFAKWDPGSYFKFVDCAYAIIADLAKIESGIDSTFIAVGDGNLFKVGSLEYALSELNSGDVPASLSMGVLIVYYDAGLIIDNEDHVYSYMPGGW